MSEATYYSKDVIDARFEALRHEVRADIAVVRVEIAALSAQVKTYGLAIALAMPMTTVILGKLWK